MKKITLTISTILFLIFTWLFILSQYHGSRLLDEMQIQVSRIKASFNYGIEVSYARFILKAIAENEEPPKEWQNLVGPRLKPLGDGSFYFYKVWFAESGTTLKDIENSYPIYAFEDDQGVRFDLRYGRNNPTIQFTIYKENEGKMKADFVFPVNNCLFNADYNNDDIYDGKDVVLANKRILSN